MRLIKLQGSADARVITIGTTEFLMIMEWGKISNIAAALDVPRIDYGGPLTPMAYKQQGHDWVISHNHYRYGMGVGMALNALNRDKKIRLERDVFLSEFKPVYSQALIEEANVGYTE